MLCSHKIVVSIGINLNSIYGQSVQHDLFFHVVSRVSHILFIFSTRSIYL